MKFIADENVEAYLVDIFRMNCQKVLLIREISHQNLIKPLFK